MKKSIGKALFKSHPYSEYRKLVSDLLKIEKSEGIVQSKELTLSTLLNETRMNIIEETFKVSEEAVDILRVLKKEYVWLVIAEGWSEETAEVLPVISKLVEASEGKIDLRICFLHENEDLIQFFLTNKAKEIPKLIVIESATGDALAHWGPRPQGAEDLLNQSKNNNQAIDEAVKRGIQMWYLHDKGTAIQGEIVDMMIDLDANF